MTRNVALSRWQTSSDISDQGYLVYNTVVLRSPVTNRVSAHKANIGDIASHCRRRPAVTLDKPSVTLSVPDPDKINGFMNIRVTDIQACYELWKSRGAEFITELIPKYGEIRCYIRDPDGYIIEVGQSTELNYG